MTIRTLPKNKHIGYKCIEMSTNRHIDHQEITQHYVQN